jgi:hypothetical protein
VIEQDEILKSSAPGVGVAAPSLVFGVEVSVDNMGEA